MTRRVPLIVAATTLGVAALLSLPAAAQSRIYRGWQVASAALWLQSGSASAPGLAFQSDSDTGLFLRTNDSLGVATGATQYFEFSNDILLAKSTGYFGWSSGTIPAGSFDTGLCRGAASVIGHGGCDSTFPSWERSGTRLIQSLGDGTDGGALVASGALITAGSGTGVTVNDAGSIGQQRYKLTVLSTQFIANATTADFTVATLPAKTRLMAIYADLTQAFACTATCVSGTLSATVGSSAGGNNLLVSFDVDAAAAVFGDADAELGTGINRASAIQGGFLGSWTTTTPVSMRLTSAVGNLGNGAATNLSQGAITFYLITERLP